MGLEDLQLLVLDEADRLLEMGFAEEVRVCMEHGAVCVRGSPARLPGAAACGTVGAVLRNCDRLLVKEVTVEVGFSIKPALGRYSIVQGGVTVTELNIQAGCSNLLAASLGMPQLFPCAPARPRVAACGPCSCSTQTLLVSRAFAATVRLTEFAFSPVGPWTCRNAQPAECIARPGTCITLSTHLA